MMKTITKIKNSKALVTLVWVLGLLVIWEIFAFIIQATKRTPENIMPHVWQIFYSLIDPKPVSNGMSCLQVVFFNAGHDAQFASYMLPTTMVFVPSNDGHSHCEPEFTSTELCTEGASVLLNAVLKCDAAD